jgi:glycosyltransferase involved in cell wall biosynthesis
LNADPQVTAIIPCFNRGRYLGECIRSLHEQTDPRWCAVVVDDGSDDGKTPQLCDKEMGGRVTVLHLDKNHGISHARNAAVRHAATETVMNLDADDRIHPRHFEKTVLALLGDAETGYPPSPM